MMPNRRLLTTGAVMAAGALMLAACAQDPDGGGGEDAGGEVNLRFSWWGGDLRHQLTQEAIAAFENEHPGITITPQFGDFGGYWDSLSTTAAAGDLPDVIQMDEKYLRTYADQGQLLDLYTLDGLSTQDIDPTVISSGEVDGSLYALVASVNTRSMVANATLLEEAGLPVPDDETWTWDDFAQITQQVTENTPNGIYGMQYMSDGDSTLQNWALQHGESLWTSDGELGASRETLTAWWQYVLDLTESGGISPPATAQELIAAGQEGSGTATNRSAFGGWWSNQYRSLSASSGEDLRLLRPPMLADGDSRGTYNKPSMYWSVSATTDHQEEAALFVDFLVNSTEAGQILLAERGVPSNLAVREAIVDDLTEEDQVVVDFLAEVSDEVGEFPPLTPAGANNVESIIERITFEVLFGNSTPEEAADQFIAEVEQMIGG